MQILLFLRGDPTADLFVKTMVMNWGTATQAPVIE